MSMQSFHIGEFVREEMACRGWSVSDIARSMDGDVSENTLALELLLNVQDPGLLLGDMAKGLAKAFGTSEQLWVNIDRAWRISTQTREAP